MVEGGRGQGQAVDDTLYKYIDNMYKYISFWLRWKNIITARL
jgi:hypothetical protein